LNFFIEKKKKNLKKKIWVEFIENFFGEKKGKNITCFGRFDKAFFFSLTLRLFGVFSLFWGLQSSTVFDFL